MEHTNHKEETKTPINKQTQNQTMPKMHRETQRNTGPIPFGKYQLLKELGRGGMGAVYKAYDTQLKSVVALKIILNQEKEYIERFFLETATIAKLNHPGVVRFYEYGTMPRPYFTMEYIEGITLAELIKERKVTSQQLVNIMVPLCEALYEAHRNQIMHRDIKPANIMITKDGTPKIMDFGLAKVCDASMKLSKSGQILGTAHYIAPEQVEGNATYSSDIYSLGASIYEALTLRTVYQGALEINIIYQAANSTPIPLRQLNPDISPYLEAICLKCLQKDPRKRYSSFKQLAKEFKNYQANRPLIAKKYTSWDTLVNMVKKHKILFSSIAIIFIILCGALTVTLYALNYAHEEREKTKLALNKVMKVLNYSVNQHESVREDKKFAALFSQIFEEVEKYGENEDWTFIKAYTTQKSGEVDKSIDYYNKQIKAKPELYVPYNNRAVLYIKNREYDKALADLEKVRKLVPTHSEVYINYGILYTELGKYNKALKSYSTAIKMNPYFAKSYNHRGNTYRALKQYDKALADYTKAIELAPSNINAYSNRALLYTDFEEYEKALQGYQKAIKINPRVPETYINLATLYKKMGEHKLAFATYDKAIKISPDSAKIYNNRGILYEVFKKYDLALLDYKKAVKLDPFLSPVYTNLGNHYKREGKYNLALQNYHRAIKLDSHNAEAYFNQSHIYIILRKYSEALTLLNTTIRLNPNHMKAYMNRGNIYSEQNQYKKAMADFNKVIRLSPHMVKVYNSRGILYRQLKLYDKALADYNKAIEIDTKYAQAYLNRANIYILKNQFHKAVSDYDMVLKLNPQNMKAYNNRGTLFINLQQYQMAISDFKKMIDIAPNIHFGYSGLAVCYQHLGDKKRTQYYKKKSQELQK